MDYRNFIKPDIQSYGNFTEPVARAFCCALNFNLGKDVFILPMS